MSSAPPATRRCRLPDPLAVTLLVSIALLGTAPPVSAQVVINEIMQNPSAVSDTDGEWFEIHNPTASDIDIDGWTIEDLDFDTHVINNGGPPLVPAGGYVVLGRNTDSGANGGVAVDYQYANFFLGNGGDEIVLLNGDDIEIDVVYGEPREWEPGPTLSNNFGFGGHNASIILAPAG